MAQKHKTSFKKVGLELTKTYHYRIADFTLSECVPRRVEAATAKYLDPILDL